MDYKELLKRFTNQSISDEEEFQQLLEEATKLLD